MFPSKWIDDVYEKFESVRSNVEQIVSQESLKCVEGLQNAGTNVKQFCSTVDPLKYVEDQFVNVGATVEQLYSSVVPSSVESVLSAIDDLFSEQDIDPTPCTKSELMDHKADHDDKNRKPVMPDEFVEEETSIGTYIGNSKLNIINTKEGDMPEEADITKDSSNISINELSYNSCEPCVDEFPDPGCSSLGHKADPSSVELSDTCSLSSTNETNTDDNSSLNLAEVNLRDDCVLVDKNDCLEPKVTVDNKSHKETIQQPKKSTLSFISRRVYPKELKKQAARSLEMEGSLALSKISTNLDYTSDSDWEIL